MNNITEFINNSIGGFMKYLVADYEITRDIFRDDFRDCSDFLLREAKINGVNGFFAAMDGLVDSVQVSQMITTPVLSEKLTFDTPQQHYDLLKECVIGSVELNEVNTFDDCYYYLMSGFVVLFVDGWHNALALGVQGWNRRTTDEPTNEAMVKGAKECFVETLNDNKALVRKRLKTHHLKFKQINLGKEISTPVVITYIDNKADKNLVSDVESRLKKANLNTVLDYGCLDPFLDSNISSFFSAVGNTERPDTFASKLLEGRVGVMVEGTPFALYTPYLFTDNFSALDDYDNSPIYSSFMRLLRYLSFMISLFLPGLYVAVGTYHQEAIPTNLLYIVAVSEATTPFHLTFEAILIHLLYEIMREAGLRLPKTIGHAVSIIGAIVIGEATVSAGIIGAPMLVVVAVTAISSYVVYQLYESVAVLRIIFIIIGGVSGIYGLMLCAGLLFINICALNPYGVPYSAPISPLTKSSVGDTLVRLGWKQLAGRKVKLTDLKGVNNNDDEF